LNAFENSAAEINFSSSSDSSLQKWGIDFSQIFLFHEIINHSVIVISSDSVSAEIFSGRDENWGVRNINMSFEMSSLVSSWRFELANSRSGVLLN
jgi:hypothetical protein